MKNTLKNESFSGSVIIDLKDNILKYLNDRIYMLFVILTAVGSYGFLISHHTVGIDDLEYDFYYRGGLLAQGRITDTVVHWFFGLVKNQIWFLELIGILCFCLFTIMLCVIIDKFIKTKNHIPQIVFSCAFISYPLHSELFSYGGTSLAVGAGGCFMAIAMLFAMKYQDTKENKYLVFSALWLLPMLSWYESVILLYVSIVLIILLSKQIKYNDYKFKNMFFEGLQYAIPLISAFIVEVLISGIVKNLPICKGIANSSANSLAWEFSSKEVFLKLLMNLIKSIVSSFTRLYYFPIAELIVVLIIGFIIMLYYFFKTKKIGIPCCFAGLAFTLIVLTLITGQGVAYRMLQNAALFCAFMMFYIIYKLSNKQSKQKLYKFICVALTIVCIWQVSNINYWFTTDYNKCEYEKNILSEVVNDINDDFDYSKPVIFVGNIKMPKDIKEKMYLKINKNGNLFKIIDKVGLSELVFKRRLNDENYYYLKCQQMAGNSFINWSVDAFKKPNDSLMKYLKYYGYDEIIKGTQAQYDEACKIAERMQSYPSKGYIQDEGDYIIVNFGVNNEQW